MAIRDIATAVVGDIRDTVATVAAVAAAVATVGVDIAVDTATLVCELTLMLCQS